MSRYGIIVIGAGHAGTEAALASARMGVRTLLLTMNVDQIGAMSCNPAIGGLGKSQLAREVDALGGVMCRVADESAIQYRVLNESKGPAVRATRVQVDRHEYRARVKAIAERTQNLDVKQGQVTSLLIQGERVVGVQTALNQRFYSSAVIVTTGTFMNGKAHIGKMSFASGRAGEPPSIGLSDFLASLGLKIGRLKTGTVPRVDARTIDFSKVEEQVSHSHCAPLSFFKDHLRSDLQSAYIAYTNSETHDIIRGSLEESPLYVGIIESRGPRYCPSVEDKIVRFASKPRHQVFLEREGRGTEETYVGGLSTSLPYDCQLRFLRSIVGLENVEIIRPGYAIEYDYIDPTQLFPNLEMKDVKGLFFAGQVNGTSGYEEAAAQGVVAGLSAACQFLEKEAPTLERSNSYIGVMIDDLVTKGTTEPYRMFTSRAEWRLLLRQDNAPSRLCPLAFHLGLLTPEEFSRFSRVEERRAKMIDKLENLKFTPTEETNQKLRAINHAPLKTSTRASELLRRPGITMEILGEFASLDFSGLDLEDLRYVETEIKYQGYVTQMKSKIHQLQRLDHLRIPQDFNFSDLPGLTREAIEKLSSVRPTTLGQAGRISGMTPAALSILAIHLNRKLKILDRMSQKETCVDEELFDVIEKKRESSQGAEL